MTSHYGRRRPYRHANYHLQEWRRRRRAAMQRNLIVGFLVLITPAVADRPRARGADGRRPPGHYRRFLRQACRRTC